MMKLKIKITYCGFLATNLIEDNYKVNFPVTLGHEFLLVKSLKLEQTLKILKAVTVSHLKRHSMFVMSVEYCKSKDYHLCNHRKGIGTQVDGAFTSLSGARRKLASYSRRSIVSVCSYDRTISMCTSWRF